jgi:hypothetical protein
MSSATNNTVASGHASHMLRTTGLTIYGSSEHIYFILMNHDMLVVGAGGENLTLYLSSSLRWMSVRLSRENQSNSQPSCLVSCCDRQTCCAMIGLCARRNVDRPSGVCYSILGFLPWMFSYFTALTIIYIPITLAVSLSILCDRHSDGR